MISFTGCQTNRVPSHYRRRSVHSALLRGSVAPAHQQVPLATKRGVEVLFEILDVLEPERYT
jgi:hypothetical protein